MLQYCSWENPQFSQALLTELLWHCGFAYWHDMRHHTELLLHILLIEDSWQHHRIHNALMGELKVHLSFEQHLTRLFAMHRSFRRPRRLTRHYSTQPTELSKASIPVHQMSGSAVPQESPSSQHAPRKSTDFPTLVQRRRMAARRTRSSARRC